MFCFWCLLTIFVMVHAWRDLHIGRNVVCNSHNNNLVTVFGLNFVFYLKKSERRTLHKHFPLNKISNPLCSANIKINYIILLLPTGPLQKSECIFNLRIDPWKFYSLHNLFSHFTSRGLPSSIFISANNSDSHNSWWLLSPFVMNSFVCASRPQFIFTYQNSVSDHSSPYSKLKT